MSDLDVDQAVVALARRFYMHHVAHKGYTDPRPYPWAPLWALDYAKIAVETYGFDQDGLDELLQQLGKAA